MIIEVMSRHGAKAESFKEQQVPTAIISITDMDRPNVAFQRPDWLKGVLWLKFDDMETGMPNCMTEYDALMIKDFVYDKKDEVERIIVHCEAGISRSSGVAAAIMKFLDGDDMPIFSNGRYCPNMTCYRMVLKALMDTIDGSMDEDEIMQRVFINIDAWQKLQ